MLEAALLDIKPGQEASFESAIVQARPLIEASPGFQRMEIRPCVENASRYLLLVWWDRLEDHTEGFRTSDRYAR
jgi:heme-degrading monooxygenase HmoA